MREHGPARKPGPAGGPGPATSAEAITLIEAAGGPEDLFGPFGPFGSDAARRYRRLARLTHPGACPGDRRAAAAFAKLTGLWQRHHDGRHQAGPLVARGDIASLYRAGRGLLKLARDPET